MVGSRKRWTRDAVGLGLLAAGTLYSSIAVPLAAGPSAIDAAGPRLRGEVEEIHAWGLAVDEDGTIYVADGRTEPGRVWRIDSASFGSAATPDGVTLLLEAPGVRDLQLTEDGILYVSASRVVAKETAPGDSFTVSEDALLRVDLRSEGARRDVDRSGGSVTAETHIEWTSVDSLFSGPSFRVDESGCVYFFWAGRLRYRDPAGSVTTFLGSDYRGERDGGIDLARFNDVRAMTWAGNGDLFLVDVARVRVVSIRARTAQGFASGLIERRITKSPDGDDVDPRYANRIYGIVADEDGERVWVAYHGGRALLSARRSGRSGTYYEPRGSGWGPVGVARADGTIYVLETHGKVTRELRLARLVSGGEEYLVLPRPE